MKRGNKYSGHYIKTISLAWPVCLSNLGYMLVGIVDAKMVGAIPAGIHGYDGTEAQAAVALANSFYNLLLVLGIGISYGITPMVAAADASGDNRTQALALKNAFVINLVSNTIIFIFLFFSSSLLYHLHQPPRVVQLAIPFMNVMMLGMIPLSFFFTVKQFTEGLSLTLYAMIVSLAGNLLNILLNWIFIFGHWGLAPMGLQGSCWASFISRAVMSIAMLLFLVYDKRFWVYHEEWKKVKLDIATARSIFRTGLATGLQWLFEVGAFSIAVLMMGWISDEAQAAHLVAISVAATTYMITSGFSAAVSVRVGNQMGLRDAEEMRRSAVSGFHLALAFMSFSAVVMVLARNEISASFSSDSTVIRIASSLLLIASFFQLVDGLQVVALGALRGVNDTYIPTVITLVAYWGIALPCSYLFAFKAGWGAEGVWYGLSTGLLTAALMLLLRFGYVSKKIGKSI